MRTTISVDKKTRESINILKDKFNLKTQQETILLACEFFILNDVSPKSLLEPTDKKISKLHQTFVSFFRRNEIEILKPFIKDSYLFYSDIAEIVKKLKDKDSQEVNGNKMISDSIEDESTEKLKNKIKEILFLIQNLDEKKKNSTIEGNHILFEQINYFDFIDRAREIGREIESVYK